MSRLGGRISSLTVILVSLVALSLLGGLAFYRPLASPVGAEPVLSVDPRVVPPPPPPLPVKRETFLVMGVDKRPGDPGRADSMIVVSFNPRDAQISLISLPRDTWVEIPGHGFDKVNHSYAYGGERLAVQTIQALLGIPIDHYITLSFQGFERIVDELGGVDVDAEKRLYYVDPFDLAMGPDGLVIDIQAGQQRMDGLTALKYSRFRSDTEGDFGRMRRQQQVARALLTAAANPVVLSKVPQLIPAMAEAVVTDLSVADMVRLAASTRDALAHPLKTGSLGGRGEVLGGIFYLIPDLVEHRMAAYDLLIGGSPSEAFVQRARTDQAAYLSSLEEARAESARIALAAEAEKAAAEAEEAAAAAAEAQTGTGTTALSESGSSTLPAPVQTSTGTTPVPKAQPVTIAVIDASGKGLGSTYVLKLRAAGFRVARIDRRSQAIPRTQVVDHAGRAGAVDRLLALLPGAQVLKRLDSGAGEALEIVLGADLE